MLLGTLGASLLGNILASEGAIGMRQGRGIVRADCGRCSLDSSKNKKMDFYCCLIL